MDNVFIGQVIGAGLILLCSLLWLVLIRVKIPKGAPPGSFGWPLLGETVEYLNCRSKSCLDAFFNERRKRYGDVFRTHILFSPTVVIAGADAHKLLQNDGNRTLTFGHSQMMKDLFGETSLILTEGDQHKRMRKAIVGSMNRKVLKSQIPILEELSIETLKSWEGTEVLAYDELAKFTFYSILGLLLGLKPSPFTETLRQNFQIVAKFGVRLPLKMPGTNFNKALQARGRLVDDIRKVIEGRRKDGNASEDVLNYLMQPIEISGQSDLHLSDEEIIDNVLFFIFAGYETTSTALAKAIQLLSDHPHELNLVKAEQKRVLLEVGDEGFLTWEKLKSMHYTSMVINEALRLSHLGTEIFLRTSKEDIVFRGYTIPRGWNIIIDKRTTDMNPNIFKEPLKFNPNRFQENIPPYVFIPFGCGTRICPGMEFANIEMLVFIHTLAQNYSWRLTQKHNDEMEFTGIVTKPKNGIPILVQKIH